MPEIRAGLEARRWGKFPIAGLFYFGEEEVQMDFYDHFNSVKKYKVLTNREVLRILAQKTHEKACAEIFLRNQQWVCSMVAKEWSSEAKEFGVDLMDLAMAGNYGLWLATQAFNPRKGTNYFSFAKRSIESYLGNEFSKHTVFSRKKVKKNKNKPGMRNPVSSLEKIVYDNENTAIRLEDTISSSESKMQSLSRRLQIGEILNCLQEANGEVHPLAGEIIQYRYGIGFWSSNCPLSLSKTVEKMNNGYSKEGIRKIEKRTIKYLRKKLNGSS